MKPLSKDLGIRSSIITYVGKELRFRFKGEKKFKYYKIIGGTPRTFVSDNNIEYCSDMVHIHCLDVQDNEECYVLLNEIVEFRENNLKEFE